MNNTSRFHGILFLVLSTFVLADLPQLYVKTDGNNDANGLSWSTALRTIQRAIDSASDGQEIIVNDGTYYEQIDFKGKNLNLHGYKTTGDPNTIIDANKQGTAVVFRGNESYSLGCRLKDFIVRGAFPAGDSLALRLDFQSDPNSDPNDNEPISDPDLLQDTSGKDRNAVPFGDVHWLRNGREGEENGAILFDGLDDYIEVSDYKGIVGKGSRTCCAWIKTSELNAGDILSWGSDSPGKKWYIAMSNGVVRVFVYSGNVIGTTRVDDGNWHHIAVVLEDDGSPNANEIKLYIDGVEDRISSSAPYGVDTGTTYNVKIGTWDGIYGGHYKGQVDEVRIFSRALSQGEIQQQALSGPVAHWKLNESSGTTADDAVNSNDGTLHNMSDDSWVSGRSGNALIFDGTNDYVEAAGYKGITGTASRTCSAWIKTTDSEAGEIISWGTDSPGSKWLVSIGGGLTRVYVYSGYVAGTFRVDDGKWHHIAVVLNNDGSPNANEIKIFVDGQEDNKSISVPYLVNTGDYYNVKIGAWSGISGGYYKGCIDDVRIFDWSLSQNEILQMIWDVGLAGYWKLNGDPNDYSGNAVHGQAVGMPGWQDSILDEAVGLDGGNENPDRIMISNAQAVQPKLPLTMSAWIYLQEAGTKGYIVNLDSAYSMTNYSGAIMAMRYNGSDTIAMLYGDGGSLSPLHYRAVVGSTVLRPHCWYHVVGVIRGPLDMSIYINGVQDAVTYSGSGGNIAYLDAQAAIGYGGGQTDRNFKGMIDEVRVHQYGLNNAQVLSLYQERFAEGGGIRGNGTEAAISQCSIEQNKTVESGGGIDSVKGDISGSYIMNNTAGQHGGGLSDCNNVDNCVIAKNVAQNAGAMDNCDGDIVNCTIADNAATLSGGGLRGCNGSVVNTILWNNRDNSGVTQDAQVRDCNDAEIIYSSIQNWIRGGAGNINGDPNFVNSRIGDYHLGAGSVSINAGDTGNHENQVDLDGNPRAKGRDLRIDQGAYEFQQTIWYVDDNALEDTSPGIPDDLHTEDGSREHPFDSIQEAINDIPSPGNSNIVVVLDGYYTGLGNRDIDFGGKAITVRSQSGPETCIIDCQGTAANPHRGFNFHSGEASGSVIDGFTVKNGYITYGGGVYTYQASPTIRNCVFQNNFAGGGGAICNNRNCNPSIINTLFLGNSAHGYGGAIENIGSSPVLINCTIVYNSASYGGGMKNVEDGSTVGHVKLYNW